MTYEGEGRGPYEVPRYREVSEPAWYHVLHGTVPGHQIDFIYCPEVPQGPLTQTHFAHVARLIKYIEPREQTSFAFAIGNLSRDDIQLEAGHGGLALIFGLRVEGEVDHAGRAMPPYAHGVLTVDRAVDYSVLVDSIQTFYRRFLRDDGSTDAASSFYRAYARAMREEPAAVEQVLRDYTAGFNGLPQPGRSKFGCDFVAPEHVPHQRITIVYPGDEPFSTVTDIAATLGSLLYRSNIKWTSISNGREVEIPGGVSVRIVPESERPRDDVKGLVIDLDDVPEEDAEIAEKLFGAKPRSAEAAPARPTGWREKYAAMHGRPLPQMGAAAKPWRTATLLHGAPPPAGAPPEAQLPAVQQAPAVPAPAAPPPAAQAPAAPPPGRVAEPATGAPPPPPVRNEMPSSPAEASPFAALSRLATSGAATPAKGAPVAAAAGATLRVGTPLTAEAAPPVMPQGASGTVPIIAAPVAAVAAPVDDAAAKREAAPEPVASGADGGVAEEPLDEAPTRTAALEVDPTVSRNDPPAALSPARGPTPVPPLPRGPTPVPPPPRGPTPVPPPPPTSAKVEARKSSPGGPLSFGRVPPVGVLKTPVPEGPPDSAPVPPLKNIPVKVAAPSDPGAAARSMAAAAAGMMAKSKAPADAFDEPKPASATVAASAKDEAAPPRSKTRWVVIGGLVAAAVAVIAVIGLGSNDAGSGAPAGSVKPVVSQAATTPAGPAASSGAQGAGTGAATTTEQPVAAPSTSAGAGDAPPDPPATSAEPVTKGGGRPPSSGGGTTTKPGPLTGAPVKTAKPTGKPNSPGSSSVLGSKEL